MHARTHVCVLRVRACERARMSPMQYPCNTVFSIPSHLVALWPTAPPCWLEGLVYPRSS